jgi:hypothetical protein
VQPLLCLEQKIGGDRRASRDDGGSDEQKLFHEKIKLESADEISGKM